MKKQDKLKKKDLLLEPELPLGTDKAEALSPKEQNIARAQRSVDRLLKDSLQELQQPDRTTLPNERNFTQALVQKIQKTPAEKAAKTYRLSSIRLLYQKWATFLKETFVHSKRSMLHWAAAGLIGSLAFWPALAPFLKQKEGQDTKLARTQARPKETQRPSLQAPPQTAPKKAPAVSRPKSEIALRKGPEQSLDAKEEELLLNLETAADKNETLAALKKLKEYYEKTKNKKKAKEIQARLKKLTSQNKDQ